MIEPTVERGDQEGTVSPNWLSPLELWRHLYTGKEKSSVRRDLSTNFKSHFYAFACINEPTFLFRPIVGINKAMEKNLEPTNCRMHAVGLFDFCKRGEWTWFSFKIF